MSAQPPLRRKNLVVLRAGDGSLHPGWIAQPNRDFDIFVSYYGKQPGLHQDSADYYEHRPGPKWPCIAELLAAHPQLLEQYDAFWFPDDDLAAGTDTLNRMFALFHGHALALAQPALTADSYYSWKAVLQNPSYILRHVDFVEVMAPLFDRHALRVCLPTFAQSRSGWGLDWVWPSLVSRGRDAAVAIIDATPVKHTRPLGGDLYKNNPELNPALDEAKLVKLYGLGSRRSTARLVLHSVVSQQRPDWLTRLSLALRRLNAQRRFKRAQSKAAPTA